MKLTKTMREAFVRAVMQDVPKVDYEDKIRSLANKEVAKAQKAAGVHGVDASRLARNYDHAKDSKGAYCFQFVGCGLTDAELRTIREIPAMVSLCDELREQEKRLQELRIKLTGAINACTTRKQAAEALPEFEKYLPADEPKALRSLPAMANVAADFVKAGWPKNAKKGA